MSSVDPKIDEPKIYGWCPGALRPMMSGDGLVLRLRPPLGRLNQQQARAVARLSEQFGNGRMDLSARANLQLRGIRESAHGELIAALRDLDLVDETPEAEARRNILLTPFWHPQDDSHLIAQALSRALSQATDLTLPSKFGFAVDTGAAPVLRHAAADIRIERAASGLIVLADGATTARPVTMETAAAQAIALARWFVAEGGAPDGRGRMHRLIARRAVPQSHDAGVASPAPQPTPGRTQTGQLVGLEFGQISAQVLAALAQYGPLRLTPWRALLVETDQDVAPHPGLILDATDPRLHVVACTGAPGCLQALGPTRNLARDLAKQLPAQTTLHVSGCSKGCANPRPADLTLVARSPDRFDLIKDGTASDTPHHTALTASALRAAPELLTKGS